MKTEDGEILETLRKRKIDTFSDTHTCLCVLHVGLQQTLLKRKVCEETNKEISL